MESVNLSGNHRVTFSQHSSWACSIKVSRFPRSLNFPCCSDFYHFYITFVGSLKSSPLSCTFSDLFMYYFSYWPSPSVCLCPQLSFSVTTTLQNFGPQNAEALILLEQMTAFFSLTFFSCCCDKTYF